MHQLRVFMLNNKPFTSCHWFLCFGTRPRHQTRAPGLDPPRLKKAKSNFFTNRNILHTLKNEPLSPMLLHTSKTMDGYLTCWKDELGKHTLGTKAQNMHQLRVFGAKKQALYFLPLPSTSCQWFLCFGTRPRHQTRAPWLGPPRLKKAKSNSFQKP